jgi:hypothetical protein
MQAIFFMVQDLAEVREEVLWTEKLILTQGERLSMAIQGVLKKKTELSL